MLEQLGVVCTYLSDYAAARQYFLRAQRLCPELLSAGYYLGQVARIEGDLEAAQYYFEQNLKQDSDAVVVQFALANTLQEAGALEAAHQGYVKILLHYPEHADSHFFLSRLLVQSGQTESAQEHFLQACQLDLRYLAWASDFDSVQPLINQRLHQIETLGALGFQAFEALLLELYHLAYVPLDWHARLIHRWGTALRQSLQTPPMPQIRPPRQRLRLGYISYKFRTFTSTPTLQAFLREHDHQAFEVCLLAEVAREDAVTETFRQMADRFVNIYGRSDAEVCALIRAWEIDILIDLCGHALQTRLPLMAYRPAPLLVSTPLGFASSTGLVDYYLVDAPLLYGGGAAMFNEQLIPMRSALIWEPSVQVRPAPAERTGQPVVLGFCNQSQKISRPLVQAWARILSAVPDASLVLKCPALNDPAQRFALKLMLVEAGVPLSQVRFTGYTDYVRHLEFLTTVDLLLDATPFQGGVTTCDALWMGLPVLSVWTPGRVGNCFLAQAGQTEFLCTDLEDYVARAVYLARNPEYLRRLRPQVQTAFEQSLLMQPVAFTRELEQIYTHLWAGVYTHE